MGGVDVVMVWRVAPVELSSLMLLLPKLAIQALPEPVLMLHVTVPAGETPTKGDTVAAMVTEVLGGTEVAGPATAVEVDMMAQLLMRL